MDVYDRTFTETNVSQQSCLLHFGHFSQRLPSKDRLAYHIQLDSILRAKAICRTRFKKKLLGAYLTHPFALSQSALPFRVFSKIFCSDLNELLYQLAQSPLTCPNRLQWALAARIDLFCSVVDQQCAKKGQRKALRSLLKKSKQVANSFVRYLYRQHMARYRLDATAGDHAMFIGALSFLSPQSKAALCEHIRSNGPSTSPFSASNHLSV